MVDEEPDSELIDRVLKRDPNALGGLYDRYGQAVYSLFLRITRNESAAEDLVQELFMRVWQHARDFNSTKGSLGVWILSIARNMAIDHVRSADTRFRTRLLPLDDVARTLGVRADRQTEHVLDQARTLRSAFTQLSFNQKRVLELAYFEGMSQSEIAKSLNEPLGTVKSWMRSAMIRLRSTIKGNVVL